MQALLQPLQRAISVLLVLMLAAMVTLTFADVLGRRLLNAPVFGANDLTAPRGHLSVDLFDHWLLTPRWRAWHKAVDVLIAAVLGLIAFEYYLAIGEAREINEVSPALTIPRYWMYGFITVTTALAAVAALFVSAPRHGHTPEETAP